MLRSFKLPGLSSCKQEVLEYIFKLCSSNDLVSNNGKSLNISNRIGSYNPVTDVADPNIFIALVFGSLVNSSKSIPSTNAKIITTTIQQASNKNDKIISYPRQLEHGRASVGVGPFHQKIAKDPMEKEVNHVESNNLAIPLRFISYKTKTALKVPAKFQDSWIQRSATMPTVNCIR